MRRRRISLRLGVRGASACLAGSPPCCAADFAPAAILYRQPPFPRPRGLGRGTGEPVRNAPCPSMTSREGDACGDKQPPREVQFSPDDVI